MKNNEPIEIPQEFVGRDLGQLAEDTLRTWVSRDTSLTLNPVEKDKEGWDCLLEFPFETPEEGMPWDTVPSRIECFIQVKGTETDARERNVKLSNWQKLISKPQPAFFLVYEFGAQDLENAYLIHVHERWMERILKRLRQERQGESRPLHKQYLTLTWSDEERVEPLNGVGLIESILKHVGNDFDEYVQRKWKVRKELGLDAPFLLHVTSLQYKSADEMYHEVVDFAIGLRSKLPLSKAVVEKDVRFGIPAEIIDKGGGELFVSPNGTEVTLTFQNSSGIRKATFPGTVYSPDYLFPGQELPSQYKKYRLVYPLGEIVFLPEESSGRGMASLETKFHIEVSQKPIEIRELSSTWRVITMLLNASSDGLELMISRAGYPPINVDVQDINVPEPYQAIAEAGPAGAFEQKVTV